MRLNKIRNLFFVLSLKDRTTTESFRFATIEMFMNNTNENLQKQKKISARNNKGKARKFTR